MRSLIFALILLSSGCSTIASTAGSAVMDAVTGDDSGLAVDTEVVAGDKEQAVSVGKTTKSDTKMDDVTVKDGGNMSVNSNTTGHEQKLDATGANTVTMNNGITFNQFYFGITIAFMFGLVIALFLPQFAIHRK